MYRRFIATIVAASVALTALGAVPARADQQDTARAVAAIVGIAIAGKLLHDRKKEKEREAAREREVSRQYNRAPVQRYDYDDYTHRKLHEDGRNHHHKKQHSHKQQHQSHKSYKQHPVKPRPLPRRVDRKQLPGDCFRSFDTRQGRELMFGRRCLENNYRYANRLPQQCALRIRTTRGFREGYDARCLRRAGYSLARG